MENLKVTTERFDYNADVRIIGETYYPHTENNQKGVIVYSQYGLFVNDVFQKEIPSKKGRFIHWSLLEKKIITEINSKGVHQKLGLTKSFAVCLIENGEIVKSNRNLNKI